MINVEYSKADAVNVNYQDSRGKSALHYVVEMNNIKMVNLLIKNFADVRC